MLHRINKALKRLSKRLTCHVLGCKVEIGEWVRVRGGVSGAKQWGRYMRWMKCKRCGNTGYERSWKRPKEFQSKRRGFNE
jgi:hypothetical protein